MCKACGLPEPRPEYLFHPVRKWRFDYAWPDQKIALEVDGGIWTQGRHTRGAGKKNDMEKFTAAAMYGWRILYFEPSELDHALPVLQFIFERKP
jgi:very-short-patch-repair endonuclease